jgi:hypothetical protein|mmetsp:Transcript_39274/g.62200  ORF Transcript_39274/g.62200 Transcript_39274/m.62200 type:complete len:556 (+) Transcript_39274:165-1832(+)
MKVRITLIVKASTDAGSTVDVMVNPSDTATIVMEKVAGVQLVPFPDQELSFDGKVLAPDARLSECGLSDGCNLTVTVKADENTLAQQLGGLLQARDLSADELGLLYCYKHGASIKQALKLLGFEGKLDDFVAKQKTLTMNNGSVAVVREDTSLKPFSAADEVAQILKSSTADTMEIKDLSAKFSQKFGVRLSSIIGCRVVEFLSKNPLFVVHGHQRVSLKGAQKKATVAPEAPLTDTCIEAPPGLGDDAPPGLGGCEENVSDSDSVGSVDAQQYQELHDKICSRSFNSKATQTINDFVSILSENTFLDIDHVVIGGSIGKGVAIADAADADITLFVRGLPLARHTSWLPQLLRAVTGSLPESLPGHDLKNIVATEDSINFCIVGSNSVDVSIHISPAFDSYAKTIQVLGESGPESRKLYSTSVSKERTQFISRQQSSVKTTIRLMKWWRNQQEWSSQLTRPSDDILELATVYSAIQTKPSDQKTAVANVMSCLSRFDQLRVVWSNYYNKNDVWSPLLRQRPLLMDPTNPYLNVADPQAFDPRELISMAQTTHFFW